MSTTHTETVFDLSIPVYEKETIANFYQKNPGYTRFKISRLKFALTADMRRELLDVAGSNRKYYILVKLEFETGMRVGEISNLTINQLNLHSNYINVEPRMANRYVMSWQPKTTASTRQIPITNELKMMLKILIGNRKVGYVFESRKGHKKIGGMNIGKRLSVPTIITQINMYAKQCKSIGRTIGSHALRRTFASYSINHRNGKIGDISQSLGHKNIKHTMLYLFTIKDFGRLERIRKITSEMNDPVDMKAFRAGKIVRK